MPIPDDGQARTKEGNPESPENIWRSVGSIFPENRNATMSDVPPTRMNQQVFKLKLKAAEGGHRLLKKKADALKVRLFPARRSESMQEGRKRRGVMCSDGAVVKK